MSAPRLVAVFCLAEVLGMVGFSTFPALLPTFLAEWRISNTEAGWINGIIFAAYVVAVPVLVSLTDRVDPRRIYVISALITAVSALGFAVIAAGFWTGLLFRALAGIGLAGTYMPGLKALSDHVEGPRQSRAVAFYTATFSIGASFSYFFSGEVAEMLGWRWAFGFAVVGALAAGALMWSFAPPADPDKLRRPDTGLLDFRPVLVHRPAMGYVFAYAAHNWELFGLRSWMVAFLAFSAALQTGPLLELKPTVIATVVTLLGLPASVLGNELAARFDRRRVVMTIMVLSAALAAGIGFTATLPYWVIVVLFVVYGMLVTGDSASITAGAVANAPPGYRGTTMAVHACIGFIGSFLGPLAFGVVLDLAGGDTPLGWGLAFAAMGLGVAMGPVALVLLGRGAPPPGPEQGEETQDERLA